MGLKVVVCLLVEIMVTEAERSEAGLGRAERSEAPLFAPSEARRTLLLEKLN